MFFIENTKENKKKLISLNFKEGIVNEKDPFIVLKDTKFFSVLAIIKSNLQKLDLNKF